MSFVVVLPHCHLRCFFQDLEQLAAELRAEIVFSVSKTGGHLSASLGVVELAVALHHVFNTPEDKIIWDVGHQVQSQQQKLCKMKFIFRIRVDFGGVFCRHIHTKFSLEEGLECIV